MSMSSPEMQHEVRQLDDDVQAIYVMLSDIQGTQTRHSNRLQELAELMIGQGSRLDSIDAKLETVLEILRDRS